VIRLLQAARDAGTTIVAASHDPDVISAADTRLTLGSHEERLGPPPRKPHVGSESESDAGA
jgi:ABC-type lipoprotein export system ATPase subunit